MAGLGDAARMSNPELPGVRPVPSHDRDRSFETAETKRRFGRKTTERRY